MLTSFTIGLAYRVCLMLHYNKASPRGLDTTEQLDCELRRRCFWACWGAVCIYADPAADAEFCWREAAGTPLPAQIVRSRHGFEVGCSQQLDESWNVSFAGHAQSFSVVGEVLKLLGVWSAPPLVLFLVRQLIIWPGQRFRSTWIAINSTHRQGNRWISTL